ncbi:hypothetical protein KHA96_19645 [Bacillus sp. FJAT-49711]|uniref:hypothetical protein n=1 Tax=Bacillus sp. FJAT-49711 TaxID=2833585 RepID=UPI001BC92A19|nr:hypothetical protein [Bacillus sp. FJAT-49711]MBS4220520.1 hypothetical protein [Bacillus sp. FJAT-49711]
MGLVIGIMRIVLPIIIVGGIGVFVVKRLEYKYNQGNLGKKKSKSAQDLLVSLIPFGMLFGCSIGIILSIFFQSSPLSSISLGAGIGLLFGYFAFEIYSTKRTAIHK